MDRWTFEAAITDGLIKPVTLARFKILAQAELSRRQNQAKRRKRGKDRRPRKTSRKAASNVLPLDTPSPGGAIFWQHAADKCGLLHQTLRNWMYKKKIKCTKAQRLCTSGFVKKVRLVQLADVEARCRLQNIARFHAVERESGGETFVLMSEVTRRTGFRRTIVRHWCAEKYSVRCIYSLGTPHAIWCLWSDIERKVEERGL